VGWIIVFKSQYMFNSHNSNFLGEAKIYYNYRFYKYLWTFLYSKPTRCTSVSNLFYFGMTLYMFRTVFPSIIRS